MRNVTREWLNRAAAEAGSPARLKEEAVKVQFEPSRRMLLEFAEEWETKLAKLTTRAPSKHWASTAEKIDPMKALP